MCVERKQTHCVYQLTPFNRKFEHRTQLVLGVLAFLAVIVENVIYFNDYKKKIKK